MWLRLFLVAWRCTQILTNFNVGQRNTLGYIISPFLIGIYIKKFGTSIKHPLLWLMISLAFTYCLMIFWVNFTYGPMSIVSEVLLFIMMMNFKHFYKVINNTSTLLKQHFISFFAILTYGLVFVFDTVRQQVFRLFKVELLGNKVMDGLRKLFN